jgi:RpiR family carbohydrate utilization transcriptional regulator
MTSRLAHLAIIDILSATVSSIFGNKLDVQTNEVIENLNKTRI